MDKELDLAVTCYGKVKPLKYDLVLLRWIRPLLLQLSLRKNTPYMVSSLVRRRSTMLMMKRMSRISDIEHREQCNPYNADNMLPLFTAPMSSVIEINVKQNFDVEQEFDLNSPYRGGEGKTKEEVAQGTYANLAIITHSSSEFIMDFIRVMPGMPKAGVQSRIVLAVSYTHLDVYKRQTWMSVYSPRKISLRLSSI